MADAARRLQLPLDRDVARSLHLGDSVTVSGIVFTGRSRFHIRAVEDGVYPPLDYAQANCFFHVGPVMRRDGDGWRVVTLEPTSSIRFKRYAADVVRKCGLRTLIGKTTVGPRTAEALSEVGGVFLSKIGLCWNRLRSQVRRVLGVHFLEQLGKTEATWEFEVEACGPFFVAVDARGDSYFEQLARDVAGRLVEIERDLSIGSDYEYTVLGPR